MAKFFSNSTVFCLLAALSLAGAVSCQRKDSLPEDKAGWLKPVRLSLSVGARSQTKMVADGNHLSELGDSPSFRGLMDMKMVAFAAENAVAKIDKALNLPISVPAFNALNYPGASAQFYPNGIDTFLPIGTATVLLYGRAPGDDKHTYGSLIPRGFDTQNTTAPASSFGFDPDVMYPGNVIPSEAAVIARLVNSIMRGDVACIYARFQRGEDWVKHTIKVSWNETVEDVNLSKAYTDITNEGAIIPGSGPMVESMLSSLYSFFKGYESNNSNEYEVIENGEHYPLYFDPELNEGKADPVLYKDVLNALKYEVLNRFTGSYPSGYVDVNDEELTVRFKQTELANYPESCFPTGLYYYVNTTIKTSKNENIGQSYTSTSWDDVLEDYTLGSSITSNTTSVALKKPLQFAVGMLSATVQSDRDWLQDNDGLPETTVSATGENLPVTGIILGGQYAQNFDFSPVAQAVEEGEEYFSYDNQTPGVYLTKVKSAPIRTLSLPTPEGKDVYFTLEFLNNSGKIFYGADGRVLPGRKFYMVGKMELPKDPAERKFEQVFVQDHITTLNCTIYSLAGAYNAVPDLGIPQLVIGVQTQVNWEMSSPTTVIFE